MTTTESRPAATRRGADRGAGRIRSLVEVFVPVITAMLPLVVAGVRAAAGPWVPIRDDAYFTVRSLDVATSHHPLLGAWSAGSLTVGTQINNLGPLQLDLLAPFTRFTPMGGTAIGVIAVHIAAIACVAWLIHRLLGARYVVVAMAAVSIMTWTMGSEMLITPQQHQYLLLSYLCVLVGAWAVATGDRWALVPTVFFASLLVQTHLSYPILVAAVAVPTVVGHAAVLRAGSVEVRSPTPYLVAGGVGAVVWAQTAIDQFAVSGNFANALTSGGDAESPGFTQASRIVADVLAGPTRFLRPGYAEFDPERTVGGDVQVVLLAVMLATLVAGLVVALRRGRRTASAGLAVALAASIAAILDAASLPAAANFGLLANNYRWLWPTATFLLLGTLCAVVHVVSCHVPRRGRAVALGGCGLVLMVATVSNLPTSYQLPNPDAYRRDELSTQGVLDQLREVPVNGPVIIDESNMFLSHPYTYPILTILRSRGIDYRFESQGQARRFGDERVTDGSERLRLTMWFGDEAERRRGASETVVYVDRSLPVALTLDDNG